ncbi:MAG: alpha/beta hydrolase [Sphingomonadaceae bacterium]|nr:alpha/beta hydrolase [Sphingomonadaceae bacterium]
MSAIAVPPAEAASSKRVVFENNGSRLVGDLYLPDGYKAGDKLPAIVVSGAWTTVKEQMAGRYAAEMADRGFAALAFDFTGWGQSEGPVRQLESPAIKTADIIAAAQYLTTRPEIDPNRIGALGICASAGYAVGAADQSPYIKSVALVAPWLHDRAIVDTVYGGQAGVAKLIAVGREAAASAAPRTIMAASTSDSNALMFQAPYYTERDRGLIPEYVNQFNLASWEPWLTYDALALAPRFSKPFAMVHSEAAAIPEGAKRFYAALTSTKSQLWLDNIGQFDFYDRDAPVTAASDFVAAHFAKSLKKEG